MTIDRKAFFDGIRQGPFPGKLTRDQVRGISDVLDVWFELPDKQTMWHDPRWLAYILATVFWETGALMVPVREGFAKTDAGARAAVARLFAKGRIKRNYALPNKAGVSFYGRGRVQNTHETNYRKLETRFRRPLTTEPDMLLDSKFDSIVTVIGHIEGIWTGRKLADYFTADKTDWINARRIVNGLDHAQDIAGIAKQFYADLLEAQT